MSDESKHLLGWVLLIFNCNTIILLTVCIYPMMVQLALSYSSSIFFFFWLSSILFFLSLSDGGGGGLRFLLSSGA